MKAANRDDSFIHDDSKPENGFDAARRQASDYAMALDAMARVTHSGSEKEAIESILQLFEMLFVPEVINYISLTSDGAGQLYTLSSRSENEAVIKERLVALKEKHAWTESRQGFLARIRFQEKDLGVLEIDRVKFPEHKEHYLNLTLSIIEVCGLAIENARRYQTIRDAENRVRLEKAKLEEALAKVKTLSGLLPICMHCKKIRDDKGYWNQIEVYLSNHTDVEFSHGLCRECMKKYYPKGGRCDAGR